jgi:hypothetical protein
MATYLIATITLLIGLGLGLLLANLRHELQDIKRQIAEIKRPLKRQTYSTLAGLEDATAIIIDFQAHLNTDQARINAELARLNATMDILTTLRQGPHSYNPDRPAGNRPPGWDD